MSGLFSTPSTRVERLPLKFCVQDGVLADATVVVPQDASECNAPGQIRTVGCNNLICEDCGAVVRWGDDMWPKEGVLVEPTVLYETTNWSTSDRVDTSAQCRGVRLFACRCEVLTAFFSERVAKRREKSARPRWRQGTFHPHS